MIIDKRDPTTDEILINNNYSSDERYGISARVIKRRLLVN